MKKFFRRIFYKYIFRYDCGFDIDTKSWLRWKRVGTKYFFNGIGVINHIRINNIINGTNQG